MEERLSLEQIIESEHRLALINANEPEGLLAYFKRLTLTSGRAIYDWSAEHGLYRLGIEHIFIPRTRTPLDVLSYITSSRHYGIYLLRDFSADKPAIERQFARFLEKKDGVRRLVVLFGDESRLPASLQPHTARVSFTPAGQRQTG